MVYQHTQKVPGKILTAATLAGFAVGLTPSGLLLRLVTWGTLGAVAVIFRSLTVEVDASEVRLQFGDGLIKREFALKHISSIDKVRTTPLRGWGMRWLGSGWLYNIYGLDAVELHFNDGKRAIIGTDEPDNLLAAIKENLSQLS
jgi:hypothetical protein